MEITPAGDNIPGNVIKEATSMQQSSVEEFEKDIGSMHIKQKSSNFEAEENLKMVSESVSEISSSTSVVSSSVMKKSSTVSKSVSSSTSSSTTESITFD